MGCLFLILLFISFLSCPAKSNNNADVEEEHAAFRVFRIYVKNWDDANAVQTLHNMAQENPEIDFWLDSIQPGRFADVMVSPNGMSLFQRFLDEHPALEVKITVDDVQELIIRNELQPKIEKTRERRNRRRNGFLHAFQRSRRRDEPVTNGAPNKLFDQLHGAHYPFGEYTSYSAMVRYLRTLEFYYPNIVQLVQIGISHEGRSIEGVRIGLNQEILPTGLNEVPKRKPKRAFWIDGNMHAREWASSHTALFIVRKKIKM